MTDYDIDSFLAVKNMVLLIASLEHNVHRYFSLWSTHQIFLDSFQSFCHRKSFLRLLTLKILLVLAQKMSESCN